MSLLTNFDVFSFLEDDPRPTVVFDLSDHATYANPALGLLRSPVVNEDDRLTYAALLAWMAGPSTGTIPVHKAWGLVWSVHTVRDRWRVASCPIHLDSANSPKHSHHPLANSSVSPFSRDIDTSPRSAANIRPLMDWTLHDVQDLSSYIQWFKAFDWAKTAIGPMSGWSTELRQILLVIMDCPDPRVLLWGPERTLLYNEACIPLFGRKHPGAIGHEPEQTFAEAWNAMEPIVAAAERGKTTKMENLPISMIRNGFDEECFFDLVMQPVCGPDGRVIGAMDSFSECTSTSVADRRMSTVVQIGESIAAADDMSDVWKRMLSVLSDNVDDVAYAMLFSMTSPDSSADAQSSNADSSDHSLDLTGIECVLQGSIGAQLINGINVDKFPLFLETQSEAPFTQIFRKVWTTRQIAMMRATDGTLPLFLQSGVSGRACGLSSYLAAAIPINSLSGTNLIGAIIIGLNPRRPFDDGHQLFLRLLNDRITHQVAAVSFPKEQRLAQAASEEAALRYASMSRQLLQRTQEAERREAKFSRLYENAPVGMYLLRVDGSPIYLNEAYSRITGIDRPDELRYNTTIWREQVFDEDVPLIEEAWTKAAEDKRPFLIDYRLKRPWHALDDATGTKIESTTWLRASGFPDVDDNGNLVAIMGWVNDISLQKWSEQLQQKRLEEALEAKYQSERFIDTVSHEIRNPLSAILQSADGIHAVLKKADSQSALAGESYISTSELVGAIDSAQTIIFCTQHQKRIVDDILTFSKLDSNLIILAPEVIAPITLLDRALSMFASELLAAGINASRDDESECSMVVCDASRVLQILINLLTNAIKFTRDRDVRAIKLSLHTSLQPPTEMFQGVQFIPRRKSRSVCQFSDEWGAGMETYLQFTISDTGKGLTQKEMDHLFRRFTQASPRTYSQYGGSGLGLFISKELCELHGGQIGVSSVFQQGSTFSFYIKALQHEPGSDGGSVSRRPSLAQGLTTWQTTSAAQLDSTHSPASERIPVPTLGSVASPPVIPSPPLISISDLFVLIVEDNLINQRVMAKQLMLAGCKVAVASQGQEALEFVRQSQFANPRPVTPHPLSVVLMDIEMPIMDGLTAAREIRRMQERGELNAHVPLAAVTANARSSQLSEALDAGMDIVVTKPFRIAEIIPRILALAEGHRTGNHDPIYSFVDAGAIA